MFGVAFASDDLFCGMGRLRSLENGKVLIEKSGFCTNARGTILISQKFDKSKVAGKKIPYSQSVNPGFVFCKSLKGVPEFVEIEVKGEWFELDRCRFKDKSYIDTGSLIELGLPE